MKPLSPKNLAVLQAIKTYTAANGCVPSYGEIAAACGLRAQATVLKHVRRLEEAGALQHRRKGKRSIRLVGACPCCGQELVEKEAGQE